MNIFDTVTGSNQRLIHPQTVGKKPGAPMIWNCQLYVLRCARLLTNILSSVSG